MKAQPPAALLTSADLRMALTAGLSAGLMVMLGLPDPFYAPMAVGAALGGTVGATKLQGTQRMLGTLLGGAIVAVGVGTMAAAMPMPLAVAASLGVTRLLGGALGLRTGYKVAGLVVAMGWTVHAGQLSSWIPARLVSTLVGVLAAWWAVRWLWPSLAVDHHLRLSRELYRQLAALLRERGALLRQGRDLEAPAKLERRNGLLASALKLQNQRQEARLELVADRIGQRLERIWDLQEQWLSSAISHYRTLLRLPPLTAHSPSLEALQQAECDLFEALAERLELWAQRWPEGRGLADGANAPEALERARLALEQAEAAVFADPVANAVLMGSSGGRRAITCHQLHDNWLSFERQWQAVP
jgi:uncharacterized membrane protein YccC